MSAAAVEHPCDDEPTLLEAAEELSRKLPGYRVEIIGGEITVTPPADGPHGDSLTEVMAPLLSAGVHGKETRVIQAFGVWMPDGPSDFAIPDLAVVDADYRDHLVKNNCYDPAVFRLVVEVTSSNYGNDLKKKVSAYAAAGIPAYVIVDRRNNRLRVLTEPTAGEYRVHAVYPPGESVTLPEACLGARVTLDVATVLDPA
ncbi:Uma2 family endonuclease [Streptomyces sp. WAC 00631]|uniref:Uma2 family endonuclease n=1 Tax=unclassified Streptomyces TaxID=2593676 RepID=UPI000F7B9B9A|nr:MULTISPECIES: Uma2 family endonuclease [unclassified Streptomyces]MCC5035274.1 Uma2 family endonuclease [Streptomyces sp. WAC 00631]MCC9739667.1 Uma2 family endonuclease [Streptomyces sp. MNU89]